MVFSAHTSIVAWSSEQRRRPSAKANETSELRAPPLPLANSAPAKGRVERAHLTLQDRLVKELRIAGVCSIEDGNVFLPGFVEDYNRRFGREPQSPHDAHRPMLPGTELDDIFRWQEERRLTRNLTVTYKRVLDVVEATDAARAARGQRVRVYEDDAGNVSLRHGETELTARAFPKDSGVGVTPGDIVANKSLGAALAHIRRQQQKRERERLTKARTRRERRLLERNLGIASR